MPTDMVLTVVAADRPGLVQRLAETVAASGGNWIDSSMARLAGEFAGIVRISVPETSVAALEQTLAGLAADGIIVTARRSAAPPPVAGRAATLELTGTDHPGIVRDISSALARRDVSIEELETQVLPGSMSGEPIFSARARILLPAGLSSDSLSAELEAIAQDIMVDIVLKEAG